PARSSSRTSPSTGTPRPRGSPSPSTRRCATDGFNPARPCSSAPSARGSPGEPPSSGCDARRAAPSNVCALGAAAPVRVLLSSRGGTGDEEDSDELPACGTEEHGRAEGGLPQAGQEQEAREEGGGQPDLRAPGGDPGLAGPHQGEGLLRPAQARQDQRRQG